MKKSGKLLSAFAATMVLLFMLSIDCCAAQIDSLSVQDGVLDVYVTGLSEEESANAGLYVTAGRSDGVVSVVNFCSITDGKAEGTCSSSDGKIYVWDEMLSPLMLPYDLIDGRAYASNSDICVQQSNVIVVSEINDGQLKGYEAGSEIQYSLAENIEVTGMTGMMSEISEVQPGSVVSPLFDREGHIAVLEVLAALGGENNNDCTVLKANCGEHAAADGSERYVNVIGVYYSAALKYMTVRFVGDEFENGDEQNKYTFESSANRYVVHMSDNGAVDAVDVDADWSGLQEIDGAGLVYVCLRYDSVDDVVKEAVFYCFSEDADVTDGGDYSDVY